MYRAKYHTERRRLILSVLHTHSVRAKILAHVKDGGRTCRGGVIRFVRKGNRFKAVAFGWKSHWAKIEMIT